jgi:arylformamidase
MKIWDISRTLADDLAPWPGDTPFHFKLTRQIPAGDVVNLGAISTSVHNGTHADSRFHFEATGETIERAPLDIYLGPAMVVDLADQRSAAFVNQDKCLA